MMSYLNLFNMSSRIQQSTEEHAGDHLVLQAIYEGRCEYDEKLHLEDEHRAVMTAKEKPEAIIHRMLLPGDLKTHSKEEVDPEEQANVYGQSVLLPVRSPLFELGPHSASSTGYGDNVAAALRAFQQGRLEDLFPNGKELLPFTTNRTYCVLWARVCYEGGYIRTNQLLGFTMEHVHEGTQLTSCRLEFLTRESPPEDVFIKDIFNDPSKTLELNSFDVMMFSLNQQPMEQMDGFSAYGLIRFLFKERKPFGSDLASLNIQRGRDFVVRSYNDYREWAGLGRIKDFSQLGDLSSGGVLEPPTEGAVVGPTFVALLSPGYTRYKQAYRYYFTNGIEINPGAFTLQQLGKIRRATLAGIICANVDHKEDFYQAPQALRQSSADNVPVPCTRYDTVNLGLW
ncbi:AAEL003612-PA [Aedes aegypti]|uniref:AAEL003612-PA n=1 Tax=Aedes aegypti TaxID=7159 RepID=Q17EY4_AEDAE|nr:AAEL003612-PA [Aedes aegypti]